MFWQQMRCIATFHLDLPPWRRAKRISLDRWPKRRFLTRLRAGLLPCRIGISKAAVFESQLALSNPLKCDVERNRTTGSAPAIETGTVTVRISRLRLQSA